MTTKSRLAITMRRNMLHWNTHIYEERRTTFIWSTRSQSKEELRTQHPNILDELTAPSPSTSFLRFLAACNFAGQLSIHLPSRNQRCMRSWDLGIPEYCFDSDSVSLHRYKRKGRGGVPPHSTSPFRDLLSGRWSIIPPSHLRRNAEVKRERRI